jgi:Fuc2NAc and GlcNAc transferase
MLKASLLVVGLLGSLLGAWAYRSFALRHAIVADVNFRSLHKKAIPRGAGLAFAVVFSALILAAGVLGFLTEWVVLLFGIGGILAGAVGLADDVFGIPAVRKLFAQICLALWALITCWDAPYAANLEPGLAAFSVLLAGTCLFVSVWFINMYNFIDGADGMAIGGAFYISLSGIAALTVSGADSPLIYVFALLAACSLGFMPLNLPPAKVFMGDAGSIFLGYSIGSLLLITTLQGLISVWTWISILGYFLADTTTTGVYRLLFVRKWYGVHRSHAYQNLVRILDSHAKVTYGVALYNLLWALPLTVWSVMNPEAGPAAALLSVAPAVAWTVRFGPRLSST